MPADMDAGLAALLGAMVGAIGSSGAAIATSLLSRGQTRMKIRAEHVHMLQEPRRNAYIAFAECTQKIHDLYTGAKQSAALAAEAEGVQRIEKIREAEGGYSQAGDLFYGQLPQVLARVTVEGPAYVTEAALLAEEALLADRGDLHRWIRSLENGTANKEHENESEGAHLTAGRTRLDFLNRASQALADDGFGKNIGDLSPRTGWR
jgi:hypothetical protein